MPEIVLIAAVGEKNRVIGKNGDLPWHIPEDLKHFKAMTTGHALLMGRRTFDSVIAQFGRPLPDRRIVVLTSRMLEAYPEVETYSSLPDALEALSDEQIIFVGGGQTIYEQMLPHADRLELTLVEGAYEGDTFFPEYEHLIGPVFHLQGRKDRGGFRFETYVKKG